MLDDARPDVTVDTFLPFSRLKEFLLWWEKDCGHFPLWCVPYRRVHDYEWLSDEYWQGLDDRLMVDIAIYGMKQRGRDELLPPARDEARGARRGQDADLVQLLPGGGVLGDLQPQELRGRQGDHGSEQHLPQSLREDLPGGDGAVRRPLAPSDIFFRIHGTLVPVPFALVQLCYVTRSERRTVIGQSSNAITESGGSILDSQLFSNVSVSLLIEIRRSGLVLLADRLENIGLVPSLDTDPKLCEMAEAARTAPEEIVSATVQITFVHDDPDLSHEVPAVPG